jgi:hypothetical protein
MMLYAVIDTNSNVYGFIKLYMHFCLYVFLPYLALVSLSGLTLIYGLEKTVIISFCVLVVEKNEFPSKAEQPSL